MQDRSCISLDEQQVKTASNRFNLLLSNLEKGSYFSIGNLDWKVFLENVKAIQPLFESILDIMKIRSSEIFIEDENGKSLINKRKYSLNFKLQFEHMIVLLKSLGQLLDAIKTSMPDSRHNKTMRETISILELFQTRVIHDFNNISEEGTKFLAHQRSILAEQAISKLLNDGGGDLSLSQVPLKLEDLQSKIITLQQQLAEISEAKNAEIEALQAMLLREQNEGMNELAKSQMDQATILVLDEVEVPNVEVSRELQQANLPAQLYSAEVEGKNLIITTLENQLENLQAELQKLRQESEKSQTVIESAKIVAAENEKLRDENRSLALNVTHLEREIAAVRAEHQRVLASSKEDLEKKSSEVNDLKTKLVLASDTAHKQPINENENEDSPNQSEASSKTAKDSFPESMRETDQQRAPQLSEQVITKTSRWKWFLAALAISVGALAIAAGVVLIATGVLALPGMASVTLGGALVTKVLLGLGIGLGVVSAVTGAVKIAQFTRRDEKANEAAKTQEQPFVPHKSASKRTMVPTPGDSRQPNGNIRFFDKKASNVNHGGTLLDNSPNSPRPKR